jgi:hypothetical protein
MRNVSRRLLIGAATLTAMTTAAIVGAQEHTEEFEYEYEYSPPAPPPAQPPVQQHTDVNVTVEEERRLRPASLVEPTYVEPTVVEAERSEYAGPSRGMLFTGIGLFGVSYGAALIVASTSNLDADDHMVVPIAGPWMNLADRPSRSSPDVDRDRETTNRVLIVADGIGQALGAGLIVGSFLFPERRTTVRQVASHEVHIVPMTGPGGHGVAAIGHF